MFLRSKILDVLATGNQVLHKVINDRAQQSYLKFHIEYVAYVLRMFLRSKTLDVLATGNTKSAYYYNTFFNVWTVMTLLQMLLLEVPFSSDLEGIILLLPIKFVIAPFFVDKTSDKRLW